MKIIKKLTLLTLVLGLLAAPAGVKAMTTQKSLSLVFTEHLYKSMAELYKQFDSMHINMVKVLESATSYGMKESFKNMAIKRLSELAEQFKDLDFPSLIISNGIVPKTILRDYYETVEYCYRAMYKEYSNFYHNNYIPNHNTTTQLALDNLSHLHRKLGDCSSYVYYACNTITSTPPMIAILDNLKLIRDNIKLFNGSDQATIIANRIFYCLMGTFVGIKLAYSGHEYYLKTRILRLCRNNDTTGLTNFIISNPNDIHYNNNQPLRESAGSNYHEIVQILLNNGADVSVNNYEPLTNALENNCTQTVVLLLNYLKNNNLLEQAYKTIIGEDMWSYLCDDTDMQKSFKLIQKRFKTYCKRLHVITPLHCDTIQDNIARLQAACMKNEVDIAQKSIVYLLYSLTRAFDINCKMFEYEGQSLLHCAAEQNNPEIIKLLFKFGHKPNPINKDGLTPLQLAQKLSNEQALDVLLTSSTINMDNNKLLQRRGATKKLLEQIPALTSPIINTDITTKKPQDKTILTRIPMPQGFTSDKIDTIKYICTLIQHKHDAQPLLKKLSALQSKKIEPKVTPQGLPVGNILSFIATKDLPRKEFIKPVFNPGPK